MHFVNRVPRAVFIKLALELMRAMPLLRIVSVAMAIGDEDGNRRAGGHFAVLKASRKPGSALRT